MDFMGFHRETAEHAAGKTGIAVRVRTCCLEEGDLYSIFE
jgi:hypothetical protein